MAFFWWVMSKKIYIFYKKLVLFLDDIREDILSNDYTKVAIHYTGQAEFQFP